MADLAEGRKVKGRPLIRREGKRFNKLLVLSYVGRSARGRDSVWRCLCDCGNVINRIASSLSNKSSCPKCKSPWIKHGGSSNGKWDPEYRSWNSMKRRCYDKRNNRYCYYGSLGVTVCERWISSYSNFLKDMGRKPTPKHSIDRINCYGNYEPGNCRWATPLEQRHNRRAAKSSGLTITRPP